MIVHMIRASLNYARWKERKALAADLKPMYQAPTAEAAELALGEFRQRWPKHQVVADVWQRNWERVIPFFQFPEEVRKVIYTTNAVESLHASLRKVTKNRGSFPSEEAALNCSIWHCGMRPRNGPPCSSGKRPCASSRSSSTPAGERPPGLPETTQ